MSIKELAFNFKRITGCNIQHIQNPRAEMEKHWLNYEHKKLESFGLKPIKMIDKLPELLEVMEKNKANIKPDFLPKTKWK